VFGNDRVINLGTISFPSASRAWESSGAVHTNAWLSLDETLIKIPKGKKEMGQTNQEGDITWKRDIIHEQTQALTFDVFIAAHSPCLWRKTRFPRSRHESPHAVDASQIFSMNPGSPYLILSFMLVIARPLCRIALALLDLLLHRC